MRIGLVFILFLGLNLNFASAADPVLMQHASPSVTRIRATWVNWGHDLRQLVYLTNFTAERCAFAAYENYGAGSMLYLKNFMHHEIYDYLRVEKYENGIVFIVNFPDEHVREDCLVKFDYNMTYELSLSRPLQ